MCSYDVLQRFGYFPHFLGFSDLDLVSWISSFYRISSRMSNISAIPVYILVSPQSLARTGSRFGSKCEEMFSGVPENHQWSSMFLMVISERIGADFKMFGILMLQNEARTYRKIPKNATRTTNIGIFASQGNLCKSKKRDFLVRHQILVRSANKFTW